MLSKSAHVGFAKAAMLKRVRAVLNLAETIFGTWARRSLSKSLENLVYSLTQINADRNAVQALSV